jgi:hypothetical protein
MPKWKRVSPVRDRATSSEDPAFFPRGAEEVAAGRGENQIRDSQHKNAAQKATD